MNIGTITRNQHGNLVGRIETMKLDLTIFLVPVNSNNERAPKYEIRARNEAGTAVQIGALWEQSARESGECFLQGNIDDHSFAEALKIAAFRQQDGSYNIVWQDQRRTQNAFAANDQRSNSDAFAAAA